VLQHPLLPGRREQPLGVRTLLDDDPAGTRREEAGRLAVVAQASTDWAATTTWTPTSRSRSIRLMAESTPEANAENSSSMSTASSPWRDLRPVA
jgi:hypothetical protein